MKQQEQIVHSYYGSWKIGEKVKTGVHYLMLDEHIKKTVNAEKDKLAVEIQTILKTYSDKIASIDKRVSEYFQFLGHLIELNSLKMPIKGKGKAKKKEAKK